jgi:hypothetical protein
MAWSYDDSLSTTRDEVRFRVGDTNTAAQLLSNGTINAILVDNGDDVGTAAIACCRAIIAKLARDTDRSNVGMSSTRSQQIEHYRTLLKELKSESRNLSAPSFGGQSVSDKTTIESDTDYTPGPFARGRDDNG